MAYRYNGPRQQRYTENQQMFDYDEQMYSDERQRSIHERQRYIDGRQRYVDERPRHIDDNLMYSDDRRRYIDDVQILNDERHAYDDGHYLAKYHERDTEHRNRTSRLRGRHDLYSNQHNCIDERNRQTQSYSEHVPNHRLDSEIGERLATLTDKYRDRVSQTDQVHQKSHQRVPDSDLYESHCTSRSYCHGRDNTHGQVPEVEHGRGNGRGLRRGDTHKGVHHSKRPTENRPYYRSSTSSRGSSHYEEFDQSSIHSKHRITNDIGDQSESFTRKGYSRETRHDKAYRPATGGKSEALIEDTPALSDRIIRMKSPDSAKKYEPLIKEEFLSDFSDYSGEMQHELLVPDNRIGQLPLPNQSQSKISSRPRRNLLPTQDTEAKNDIVKSGGLLQTPSDIEADTTVCPSTDVIPISVGTLKDRVYTSGLLQTPAVATDMNVAHASAGLLPTPTKRPNRNPDHQSTGLFPTATCSPLDNPSSETLRAVESIVYPSKGLLPTPPGSPIVSISSHPLMVNDETNFTLHDAPEKQDTHNHNEKFVSLGTHVTETEAMPKMESKQAALLADKQSPGNKEKQMLENIQIQIEQTMQSLQQKIQTSRTTPSSKKENEMGDKSDKPKELQKNTVVSEDTDFVEVTDNVEKTSDTPINIPSENDNQCSEKQTEITDNSQNLPEIKTESKDQRNTNNSGNCEAQFNANVEQFDNIKQQTKETSHEHSRKSKGSSGGQREYKTYREWRLAKERMNKFFNSQSSESEDNIKKREDSNRSSISKSRYQRNSLNSPNSNLLKKGSEANVDKNEQIDDADKPDRPNSFKAEERLYTKRVIDNSYSPQDVGPDIRHSDIRDSNIFDAIKGHKKTEKMETESISDRFGNKKEEQRRERRDSNISNDSFSEKLSKKKLEGDKTEKLNESDKHEYKKKDCTKVEERTDSKRVLDRKYSPPEVGPDDILSDKKESDISDKNIEHKKKEKTESERMNEKFVNKKEETIRERRDSNLSDEILIEKKKERDKTEKINENDEHKYKKNELRIKHHSSESSSSHHSRERSTHRHDRSWSRDHKSERSHKHKSSRNEKNYKDHSYRKPDEHHHRIPGSDVKDGNLKNVYVKLFDINKNKATETNNAQKDASNARENIFEKMSENISSLKKVDTPSTANKSKENISSNSTKTANTFTPAVPISEDSSSDVDPFVKMSLFLNKNKKKPVLIKTDKVFNSSISKRPKSLNDFLVTDDQVSFTENSDTVESSEEETLQFSSSKTQRKKKEFVKYLKRVNQTLYWKNVKLMLPRINLKRLDNNDIKRLKSKLKKVDKPSDMTEKLSKPYKSAVGSADRQEQNNKTVKEDRNRSEHLKVGANECAENAKIKPDNKESETCDAFLKSDKTGSYTKAANDRDTGSLSKIRREESKSLENSLCNDEMSDPRKESSTSGESKQNNEGHASKTYRRIICCMSSSAEQSESSDIERVVSVSQRNKQGPVIEDSDESEELEGSLGSEDSTCLDMSDVSEAEEIEQSNKAEVAHKEQGVDELNCNVQSHCESHVVKESMSSEIGEKSNSSVQLPVFENDQNCEESIIYNNSGLGSSRKERRAQEPKAFPLKTDTHAKRNIFSDVTSDYSTQSENDAGTSYNSKQSQSGAGRNILETSTSMISKVRANLGNKLKNLKVNNLQASGSGDSSSQDFLCLPERQALLQRSSFNVTTQSENENADEVDGIDNSSTGPDQSVQENNVELIDIGSKKVKDGDNKLTCSESARKNIGRRKYSDSSTDSSDNENFCENRSATKYRKRQFDKSSEEKSVSPQNSKDDGKSMHKNSSPRDTVFGKHLPSRAKRLFKSSSQIKRTSSIMQMDGNADLIAGPPDESSGEEGDVEDNLSYINIEDSEEENSASQDLFADLPDRLKQMSQKFKQIVASAPSDFIKTEKEEEANDNKPVIDSHIIDATATTSKSNCLEENRAGNIDVSDNEVPGVKEEPDWLKCYTQEPDTIFLSDDDDDMIMTVSQPVILVSDEDTQDPEADQKPVLDLVKQEKLEPDEKYGTQESTYELTFENYSSAEDWSDKGSDFEPENMFSSLQKKKTLKTDAVESGQNLSESSLMSDDDLFKSQSLLEPDNTSNENNGFESSDGAVMSVNEDELLRSPNSDEAIMSINEDELLGIRSITAVEQRSGHIKSEKKANVTEDFSSDDDEILSTSVFGIENKNKRAIMTTKAQTAKVKTETDVIDSSQSFEPVQQQRENDGVKDRSSDRNLPSSSSKYQEMAPYMQDTQVDPSVSDENTSNSVSVFDFHSEHFSDISDSDSKPGRETEIVKNLPKPASNRNFDYETLSDDSDIMIIDNPKSEYEVQTQVTEFLHKKENNFRDDKKQIDSVYEEQTQVNDGISEPDNKIQDQYFGSAQTESLAHTDAKTVKRKTDKGVMQDFYLAKSQADKFGPSSGNIQTQAEKIESRQYTLQTQAQTTGSDIYSELTQIDQPGPSKLSKGHDVTEDEAEDIIYDSFSDEDPQLMSYFQQKTRDNPIKKMRLSQNLGIKFETFSDSGEEESTTNIYETLTQVDQPAQKQNKQTNKSDSHKKAVKGKGKKTIQKDDNIAYHTLTQAISSSDSLDAEDYRTLTQVARKQPVTSVPDLAVDDDAYFAATQADIENTSEKQNEHVVGNEDIYNMATQMDANNLIEGDENKQENVRIISECDQKVFKNEQQQESSAGDDVYLAATQVHVEDISEPDEDETAKDVCEMSKRNEQIKKQTGKGSDNNFAAEDFTEDKEFYNMNTQKDVYKMSRQDDEREKHAAKDLNNDLDDRSDNDAYFANTQVDFQDISEPEKEQVAEDEDIYNVASDRRGDEIVDEYNIATEKMYEMPDDDEAYYMETQVDELPDIIQLDDEDLSVGNRQDYVDTNANLSKSVALTTEKKKDKIVNKSVPLAKGILKRPNAESTTGRNVTFGVQFEHPVPKKPRLSLSKRRTLSIEPQKLKTTAEKRASGVSISFEPQQFFKVQNTTVNEDIEIYEADRSDMWLSKKVSSNKVFKKGTKMDKATKRKRKDSGEDLQAKMIAARSQLKERAMYNATHPEFKKRMKTGPTATVTSSELEDVTLPTCSQIIDQGLPLLNTTGVLLKGNKSSHSVPQLPTQGRITTSSVSIVTTTISTVTSTSVPSTVQSTSVNVTAKLHQRITEKNIKDSDKENNKHKNKSLVQSERSARGDTRQSEQSFQNADKDKRNENKPDKESSRSKAHTDKNRHRSDKGKDDKSDRHKISKDKERDRDRKDKESTHPSSKDSKNREKSGSGNSRKDTEQKSKDKNLDKENKSDKNVLKSDESKNRGRNDSGDSRVDKEKHGKKSEDRKHSGVKDRHSSGQKMEKQSSSKHSESGNKEKNLKCRSDENSKNMSRSSGSKITISSTENDILVTKSVSSSLPVVSSTATSASLSTSVTSSITVGIASSSLFTPGVSSISTTLVTISKTTPSILNISTAVGSGTSTSMSRSIAKPVPSVRSTVSTHIQSSVLLQKQGSRNQTTGASGSNLAPLTNVPGRQPFQPLVPNITGNTDLTELMPSNMVENVPNLQWNNFLRVILKWSPNWFEEKEKMERQYGRAKPPDITSDLCNHSNHTLFPLLGKYVSFKEYSEKFMLPLLLHETFESCFSTWREKKGKQRLNHHKLMFSHQKQGGDKLMVYTLIAKKSYGQWNPCYWFDL
ncbi:serine-rich adhesin for platelets-like isoform X2 [Mercenaria mercenaria]|uniref:serine-rich adhesin for platelets-like isoform X2 n=1 Tax=Mercenaria mercenaria TaxID=6596 RepID=UPI00234E782A|nr:serine-rich adhesin for platelets-like isoform X2 [Mercenaria mercenaria]